MLGTDEYDNSNWVHGVFHSCGLERVELPSTLKKIEYNAFKRCGGLKSIDLPEGLEVIGNQSFEKSGLERLVLPSSVKKVGVCAFSECLRLKSVVLNDRLETLGAKDVANGREIEGYAFAKSGLESVTLPPALREIPEGTFSGCKSLKKVELPERLKLIGICAFQESGLESAEFPASLKKIEQAAFAECESLRTVKFSEGLEVLGSDKRLGWGTYCGVFEMSRLEHAELPSTLKEIWSRAFKDC